MNSPRVIHGSPKDNVVTCCCAVVPGDTVTIAGCTVTASENIPIYHKMAILPIAKGETVSKYGQPIGIASAGILPGQHVHVHNLESDRGRGDRKRGDGK